MLDQRFIIANDESYSIWRENLKAELNEYLTLSDNIACFLILDEIENSICLSNNKVDIISNIKKNFPNCISYRAVVNNIQDFSFTRFFNALSSEMNDEVINDFITQKKNEFDFLIDKEIGYEIYLHYQSVTYKIETGYVSAFKLSENIDLDDLFNDLEDENEQETEEERLEREAYEREEELRYEKMETLSRELSTDKRLALTRNRDQRKTIAKMFFGERIKEWEDWEIEQIVVRAVNIFELEILPSLVTTLINQNKTPKQISDELGISLAKAKKVIVAVDEKD